MPETVVDYLKTNPTRDKRNYKPLFVCLFLLVLIGTIVFVVLRFQKSPLEEYRKSYDLFSSQAVERKLNYTMYETGTFRNRLGSYNLMSDELQVRSDGTNFSFSYTDNLESDDRLTFTVEYFKGVYWLQIEDSTNPDTENTVYRSTESEQPLIYQRLYAMYYDNTPYMLTPDNVALNKEIELRDSSISFVLGFDTLPANLRLKYFNKVFSGTDVTSDRISEDSYAYCTLYNYRGEIDSLGYYIDFRTDDYNLSGFYQVNYYFDSYYRGYLAEWNYDVQTVESIDGAIQAYLEGRI